MQGYFERFILFVIPEEDVNCVLVNGYSKNSDYAEFKVCWWNKMTDDLLFELEDYIRTIWGFLPIPVAYVSPKSVVMEVNKEFLGLLDLPEVEVVGQQLMELNESFKELHEQAINQGVNNYELRINDYDLIASTQLHRDVEGGIVGYFL